MTQHDICGMDNKMRENKSKTNEDYEDESDEELNEKSGQSYNPNWTLRKCSSKVIERISILSPKLTIDLSKQILESDLQCQDWIKK